MAFDDEYRELLENARDALYDLLVETDVGSGIECRKALAALNEGFVIEERRDKLRDELRDARRKLEEIQLRSQERRQGRDAARREWDQEHEDYRERRKTWKETPRAVRESMVLDALGDERLVLSEITERVNAKHEGTVYTNDLRPLTMRMLAAGQLEREAETFRNKPRYRWSRKRGLDGPIVDLDRRYREAS